MYINIFIFLLICVSVYVCVYIYIIFNLMFEERSLNNVPEIMRELCFGSPEYFFIA